MTHSGSSVRRPIAAGRIADEAAVPRQGVVTGDFTDFGVYVAGPPAGASLAAMVEYILRGNPSEAGHRAATEVLSPDNPAGR